MGIPLLLGPEGLSVEGACELWTRGRLGGRKGGIFPGKGPAGGKAPGWREGVTGALEEQQAGGMAGECGRERAWREVSLERGGWALVRGCAWFQV